MKSKLTYPFHCEEALKEPTWQSHNGYCYFILLLICIFTFSVLQAKSLTIPASPGSYVNDYANLISPDVKSRLEGTLQAYEKSTSNQIVIVTFKSLEEESLEDFSIRLADKWKIGSKEHDNGVIILLFEKEHKIRIEVGYGLEGVLTDVLSNQIIRNEMVPSFRNGNYDQGILNAVNAIVAVTKGEYKSDQSVKPTSDDKFNLLFIAFLFFFIMPLIAYIVILYFCTIFFGFPLGFIVGIICIILLAVLRKIFFSSILGETISSHNGWYGGGFGGGSFGRGGFGGGGFSGGGGSFGGGGSSGSW